MGLWVCRVVGCLLWDSRSAPVPCGEEGVNEFWAFIKSPYRLNSDVAEEGDTIRKGSASGSLPDAESSP